MVAPEGVRTRAYETYGESPAVYPDFDSAAFWAASAAAAEALRLYPECAAAREDANAELAETESIPSPCPYSDKPGCGKPCPNPFSPGWRWLAYLLDEDTWSGLDLLALWPSEVLSLLLLRSLSRSRSDSLSRSPGALPVERELLEL